MFLCWCLLSFAAGQQLQLVDTASVAVQGSESCCKDMSVLLLYMRVRSVCTAQVHHRSGVIVSQA
jgi:hypothetical protein